MQTSGQFGVPPPEVSPHYNSVNNSMNNNNSNTTSTPGSNQPPLGHMLFNFPTSHDQHAPLSSPAAHPTHGQPVPPVLLGKAGSRDGGVTAAELFQESTPPRQQQQQQQQQNPRFSHFLQATAAASEHFQAKATENAPQEQMVQQTQAQAATGDQARAQVQPMQLHHQLSLGLDQSFSEGGAAILKASENQQISADPISLGDIDQADEGAGAGNRWPRQETLALLKIRADMDASFRDTSVKRPLWDEVSRKLGELGYERSAKKCKEKFENVNKYYKRTKEGKVGRQDGKNYRFFTQLEALSTNTNNNNNNNNNNNINTNHNNISNLTPGSMLISNSITSTSDTISKFKAAASDPPLLPSPQLLSASPLVPLTRPAAADPLLFANSASAPPPPSLLSMDPIFRPPLNASATLPFSSPSCDDDDDDDDEDDDDDDDDDDGGEDNNADDDYDIPRPRSDPPHDPAHAESKKRKRKASISMMTFFEGLLKKVIDKQEQMQQKFLQALERRESDRMIREEAWRRQEMARLNKEHELRAQERSSAAARDAAFIAFLQRATGQTIDLPLTSTSVPIAAQPVQCAPPLHQENVTQQYEDHDPSDPNSKRWLKPEVLALIDLHSSLQAKFTEAGPKGHLWEEIANGMAKLGYSSRTAKRCKEKWENINKYFKRAKESNKKRPENAKTCPYFHELDALYRKGSLGSSSVNQLPYKPSIEHAQHHIDDDSVVHQPSSTSINTGEGTDHRAHTLPPAISRAPPDQAVPLDAITSITSNASVVGSGDANNHMIGDVGMRKVNDNGGLQGKGMQLSIEALRGAPASTSAPEHNANSGARSSFMAELGLNSQQQPASMDLYQHKQMNQSEFGKVNAGEQESQVQTALKESKPSGLAPLPNSSSFMSSMLQKNNMTTNQDQ